MATIYSKVSTQVSDQQPDFIRSDHPDFLAFLKAYYEFLESAELKLKTFGSTDSIQYELGSTTYIVLEDTNRYRTGESNNILLEDYDAVGASKARSNGAFVNGETITGQTSKATAVIRAEDISAGSRLFISSQNKFILDEQIVGQTSGATAHIVSYTANPVQNVMQLLEYMDVDDTIGAFFTQFKSVFMQSLPDVLASGLDKRKILKSIKDLYRAKGTKKGHQLFFRILLDEDADLYYPTKDMLRISDGKWTEDTTLRVYAPNDTILDEEASSTSDIFILLEDDSQILMEDSISGIDDLSLLVGQTITQQAAFDRTILEGGPYYNKGYKTINKTTAVVDSATQLTIGGETIFEYVLNPDSLDGEFFVGHKITGPNNTNSELTITAKIAASIEKAVFPAGEYDVSTKVGTPDTVTVSADVGLEGKASITAFSAGTIKNVIVDVGGSGYKVGDKISVDNTNTNGNSLAGEVSIVNGGIAPESGTLTDNFRITLESGTPGQPGEILLEESLITYDRATGTLEVGETFSGLTSNATGVVIEIVDDNTLLYQPVTGSFSSGEILYGNTSTYTVRLTTNTINTFIANEEDTGMLSGDRFIYETETIKNDVYDGAVMVQETDTGVGDVTDIRVISSGYSYTSLPPLNVTPSAPLYGGVGAIIRAKGVNVGFARDMDILDCGVHYTDQDSLRFLIPTNFLCISKSGLFTKNETLTGSTSGATGRFISEETSTGIVKMDQLSAAPFIAGETITGSISLETAVIDSYTEEVITGATGAAVKRTGKYVNEDGFVSEASKKIQDSYYWQDYSYEVKTATSIIDWRDELLSTIHPAGWQVFGRLDIVSKLSQLANITSVAGLGTFFRLMWPALFGMRLGTVDQAPLNPTPTSEANELDKTSKLYQNALQVSSGASFTLYETITGGTSGATGKIAEDTTHDDGTRVIIYTPVSDIFQASETITGGASGVTATTIEVFGLRGERDRTLSKHNVIDFQVGGLLLNSSTPTYDDLTEFKFSPSMVDSNASSLTFRSHDVFVVRVPFSTLNGNINNSVATITVTDASDYPTAGTIQIGDELIDYTGKSSNDLTGCSRGQHGTSAASHTSGARLDSVRWGINQNKGSGYRIMDWLKDYRGNEITIADILATPKKRNNISPPSVVTLYMT